LAAVWEFAQSNYLQIADIVLVAAVFYYLFVYVRGTKTAVVIQGIVVLTLVYFICVYLELITLVFILKGILVVGPLALFIIFAPEIRQVLERAGARSRLFEWIASREPEEPQTSMVHTITSTVLAMSEQRVGGLFVIERQTLVDDHIVPGTVLDAVLSDRLLASIFDIHNPLHDGAVVLRGERIMSAGNFLPISESTFLSEDLGTRHRAAVGLTERIDAVVVVVSEERGELSIAYHGRLARGLQKEQFTEQLTALVEPNENFATVMPRAAFV